VIKIRIVGVIILENRGARQPAVRVSQSVEAEDQPHPI